MIEPHSGRIRAALLATAAVLVLASCARQPPAGSTVVPEPPAEAAAATMERADADMAAVLDALASLGGKPIETLSATEARAQPTPADAVKLVMSRQGIQPPEQVASATDRTINGEGGEIPIRIYTPEGQGPFPVIVYYHGGGWVIADLDTYDASARALAREAGAIVVASHYRQGPEHKFPAAHDDAFRAYQWTVANAMALGGDPDKIAVAGESAGGNMATAVSLRARDTGITQPVHELLIYPVAGSDMNTASYQENADAKPLNKPMMAWFMQQYLNPGDAQDPRINLVEADLGGLPPTTIIGAQIDPLRSEGQALAERLEAAGVPVAYRVYDGVTHEFFGMGAVVDDARDAQEFAGARLKASFADAAPGG
ncbi:alpha/beta hydrolase [Geminicoccus roseus]|uniref:alpha/beta hydrolase n=1 Tax=Geminicoccus roseus TaxID=404900 RepID=UPI000427FB8A|nr:alpha/beta hydrolase [Geminicoccus roseus]